MVSRNITEVFVLMRNNAIHSRQIFSEKVHDSERVRLMRSNSNDLEISMEIRTGTSEPPPWLDTLEETHYIISRLRARLKELEELHSRQIQRPAWDDESDRQNISRLCSDLGRLFTQAHSHLSAIRAQVRHGNKTEQKLASNVVVALVTTLQELSVQFRSAQSNYLRSLTSREERSNAYFDLPNFEELSLDDSELLPGLTRNQTDLLFSLPSTSNTPSQKPGYPEDDQIDDVFQKPALNQKQLMLLQEENTQMVAEREQEVNKIVRSIVDLNEIFKDLAHTVTEQGTILDRIDYNIEQTQYQVEEGYKQLKKADMYQRKNRKMHCILILAVMVVVLFVLLIIVKS